MPLTFKRLRSSEDFIGLCQELLPNHMSCPKTANYACTDDSTDPPTVTKYCTYHAKLREANIPTIQPEQSETLNDPEPSKPNTKPADDPAKN
jgi:hypothetical protein